MKSLIIEGCDCAGKSTLCQMLVRSHPFKYIHCVPAFDIDSDQVFSFYASHLHNAAQMNLFESNQVTLLDRCYLSEVVYGPIKRGVNRLAGHKFQLLDALRKEYGIRQVICVPPWGMVRDVWAAKAEDYLKTEAELRLVYDSYQLYAESQGLETYDYVNDGPFIV